jgi:hypothetical protein
LESDAVGHELPYANQQYSLALATTSPKAHLYSQLKGFSFAFGYIELSNGVKENALMQTMRIPSTSLNCHDLGRIKRRI